MKYSPLVASIMAAAVVLLLSGSSQPVAATAPVAESASVAPLEPEPVAIEPAAAVQPVAAEPAAAVLTIPVPAIAPELSAPVAVLVTTAPVSSAPNSGGTDRTSYLNAMYASVVPARERAALADRYRLGYNLPGLACGTGCTRLDGGQVTTSYTDAFFTESVTYQRNRIAHEAAHAYGFLFIDDYAVTSWAASGGWQAEFHALDRSFAATYDAEAWAACVAWKESGFNNRVDQIASVCTADAAALAIAQVT